MKRENLLLQERHDLILKQLEADGRVIASMLALESPPRRNRAR